MKATERKVENPYVGPRPFEERHQRRFFGRDWEADELVSLVIAHPAVLLYAQSGAGKTSLTNAKLIPLLRDEEGLQVMPVARVRGEVPEEIQPEQIGNLLIFNTLLGWMESGTDPTQLVNLSLSAFLKGWPRPRDEEGQPTLRVVIFDQFEELFTLYPERWTEREGFFAQVADALSQDPFLRVLFVLREDYLAQLDPFVGLLPERLRTRFRLERLRQEAALSAVEGPLRDTERSFAPGVAESLVEELLKIRVETRAGETVEVPGEFVEPVQLQVVCRSLWEELPPEVTEITHPHLWTFGDVDQALRTFYERALRGAVQQTGVKEGRLRLWFERGLITPMGTRGTAYRGAKSTGGVPNAAVDVLDEQHLIRAERRAGARWYELTHDRFIGPIQRSNEAWRATRRERWLWTAGGVMGSLVFLVFLVLLVGRGSEQSQTQALQETVVVQETAAAQVKATATAALDAKNQGTADFVAWQTAQAQATAAFHNLQTVRAQVTATPIPQVTETPQPGETATPSLDPTIVAAVETATAAAQSLQIAGQKVVAAAAELKATATAAASATAAARELGERLQTAGLTGRGVKVAILSTGIDATHPDLGGRIAASVDLVGEGIEDGNGFGTFLASIVAGNGTASGSLYKGWAPEADLYIAKVMGAEGAGTPSNIIAGLKWAVEQQVDIVLVDGGAASSCDGSDELSREADAAVEAGLVVVVPAGNSGPEPGTVGSPGCARLPITVGAAELNTVANFSSRGPTLDGRTKPDLLFSGYGVGAQATGAETGSVVAAGYVEATGSGISAAHAAGAIALLLQVNPNLTPAEVKGLLMETATDLGFEANAQGAGLANIEKALARIRDRDGDGIPDVEDACPDEPGSPGAVGCPETPTFTPSATPTEIPNPTAMPTTTPTPTPTATSQLPMTTPTPLPLPMLSSSRGNIAYVSWEDDNNEIVIMKGDGSQKRRLTFNSVDDWDPALSPDGQVIAFMSSRDGDQEIYRMNSDGGDQMRLTYSSGVDRWIAFSPDGSQIALTSYRDGNGEIYVMDSDGSEQQNLTRDPADDRDPAFSPDGLQIVFVSNRDGNDELYVMDADGGNVNRLTSSPGADWEPSFSPDGTEVIFVYNQGEDQEIYVMSRQGGQGVNLTNNPAEDRDPVFSPDGKEIVFTSDREGVSRLFVMNSDGSNVRRLTDGQTDWSPSWSR